MLFAWTRMLRLALRARLARYVHGLLAEAVPPTPSPTRSPPLVFTSTGPVPLASMPLVVATTNTTTGLNWWTGTGTSMGTVTTAQWVFGPPRHHWSGLTYRGPSVILPGDELDDDDDDGEVSGGAV